VVAGVLVAAVIGGPATAEAGTVTKVYGIWPTGEAYYYLRFAAAPGENNHLSAGTVAGEIRFQDSYPISSFTPGRCHTVPPSDPGKPGGVGCTIAGLTELQLPMGEGANEATVVGSQRTLVSGVGASKNEFTGGAGSDWIFGAEGAAILRGGGGNDRLEARGGTDELHGNSGVDLLKGEAGNDSAGKRPVVRVRVDRAVRRRLTEAGLRVRAVARTSDTASASRSVGRFIRILPPRAG
jgi:Ca2+-binding RTX toxin-like protein